MRRRAAIGVLGSTLLASAAGPTFAAVADTLRIATFSVDVTPRLGHPLLGSNYGPAKEIGDPLSARGLVLLGNEQPIVIVSVDWCELRNDAFELWRNTLARAVSTTPERVLVCCVHQHDAPYFDLTAQRLLAQSSPGGLFCDVDFHAQCVQRVAQRLEASLQETTRITHLGLGQAKVERIASNRRVEIDGRVSYGRSSSTSNPAMQMADDGEIDPWLKTISFWDGTRCAAALSSYACHPMSYYGTGRVSGDFVNAARDRRQSDDPSVFQIYANGCCGDVTAGRYNNGSSASRVALTERLYQGVLAASQATERHALQRLAFRNTTMLLPHSDRPSLSREALQAIVADGQKSLRARADAALGLSNLARHAEGHRIDVPCIDFGAAQIVLLPAESFVAYQLAAQALRRDAFVMALGFGECAPGYIPTDRACDEKFIEQHGYCWVRRGAEGIIRAALERVLSD